MSDLISTTGAILRHLAVFPVVTINSATPVAGVPSSATPTPADGYAPGIYFPSDIAVSWVAGINAVASGFARLETNGAQVWSLTGPDAFRFFLGGANGAMLYNQIDGIYYNTGQATYQITVNVTDGVTTKSKNVTVHNSAAALYSGGNFILTDAPTEWYSKTSGDALSKRFEGVVCCFPSDNSNVVTLTDTDGILRIDPGFGLLATRGTAEPLSGKYGAHDAVLHVTGASNIDFPFRYYVVQEQPAKLTFTHSGISTASAIGSVYGTVQMSSDAGVANAVIVGDDGTFTFGLSPDKKTGTLRVRAAPILGNRVFTVRVTSNNGLVTDKQFAYTVVSGTTLPASNITMAIPTGLDNYVTAQVIGTPAVTGISGTKVWSLVNQDASTGDYAPPGGYRFFDIDSATGKVTAFRTLPARADGHNITLICTDGVNSCSRTFNIPVAWKVGPTLYVGRGMAAAHPGKGYDHFAQLLPILSNGGGGVRPELAGATVIWSPDSDPDYYANDNGVLTSDYSTRFGIPGPIRFVSADPNGPRVRVGGPINSGFGGSDMSGKGYFNLADGDVYMNGFEVSFCRGSGSPDTDTSHGISGVRKNAGTWGDVTFENCAFHDCDNGVESGEGPVRNTIRNCLSFNCGGQTVSSGQTHGYYLGGSEVIFQNNVSYNHMVGHCLKTRCRFGTITDNVLGDGENGTCSQAINIPQGGRYSVLRNVLHKGPNAQNPAVVGYLEDTYGLDRDLTLTISNNKFFICQVVGSRGGIGTGIFHFGRLSTLDGSQSNVIADGNAFYMTNGSQRFGMILHDPGHTLTWTETNSTTLATPPTLDFTDPGTAVPKSAKPGLFVYPHDDENNYQNMFGVQIHSSVEDIRAPASAPSGTPLTALQASGALFYINDGVANDIRIQPFVAGTRWEISQDSEYFGKAWAPVNAYGINPSSDGTTATLTTGTITRPVGVDFVKVRATAPNGTLADFRFYITRT